MKTSLDLCFCLLTLCGITPVLHGVKVVVKEGSDAVLPCLISTKEDIVAKLFDWKKDGQKVFIYRSDIHYNNGFTDQDEQFKGRVSHFEDQLINGNASIKIHNTKVADSGNYSCCFPRLQLRQTFNIELVVVASPEPYIITLYEKKDWSLLQCEVQGASPKPKVEWQDSSGNILPAEEPQVSERGGRYYVTLKTIVTKTDHYRCVVTQEEISHQSYSETFVQLNEELSREVELWRTAATLAAVVLLVVAVVCCIYYLLQKKHLNKQIKKSGFRLQQIRSLDDSDNDSSDETEMLMPGFRLRQIRTLDDSDNDSTEYRLVKFSRKKRVKAGATDPGEKYGPLHGYGM